MPNARLHVTYRIFELSMLNKSINIGKSHSSFLSEPMTDSDIKRTLEAAQETLTTMKTMIKDIAPALVKDL
jgi:glutamate-1-semialdehyde aminotransferase